MIQIERSSQFLLATAAVDFRKAFDGLCGVVRNELGCDPLDGTVFVFYNRRRDRIKLLEWDGDGFWLHYKRLERGTFEVPRVDGGQDRVLLTKLQLQLLLDGIVLASVQKRKRYARPTET